MHKLKYFILILIGFFIFTSPIAISMPKQKESSWQQEEYSEKEKILKAFWYERILKYHQDSVNNFKDFIIRTHFPKDLAWENQINLLFQAAVNQEITFNVFFDALKDLPLSYIRVMNDAEKLIPNESFENIAPHINNDDLLIIEDYIQNKKLSLSLTLGSAKENLLTPVFPENLSAYPFAIHSIGKVFTGVLTLMMIEEGIIAEDDLNKTVQLDDAIKNQLPPLVKEQLNKVTLHQLMTHKAGLGDYLGAYGDAISKGPIPEIKHIEDFLPFIEDKVFPIGNMRYSNAVFYWLALLYSMLMRKNLNQRQITMTFWINSLLKKLVYHHLLLGNLKMDDIIYLILLRPLLLVVLPVVIG